MWAETLNVLTPFLVASCILSFLHENNMKNRGYFFTLSPGMRCLEPRKALQNHSQSQSSFNVRRKHVFGNVRKKYMFGFILLRTGFIVTVAKTDWYLASNCTDYLSIPTIIPMRDDIPRIALLLLHQAPSPLTLHSVPMVPLHIAMFVTVGSPGHQLWLTGRIWPHLQWESSTI